MASLTNSKPYKSKHEKVGIISKTRLTKTKCFCQAVAMFAIVVCQIANMSRVIIDDHPLDWPSSSQVDQCVLQYIDEQNLAEDKPFNSVSIPALGIRQVIELQHQGRFLLKSVNFTNSSQFTEGLCSVRPRGTNERVQIRRQYNEYDYQEAARLLSHLVAINQAYTEGLETVLFLEDDAIILSDHFLSHWKSYSSLAPDDWSALQWVTSNDLVVQHGGNLLDPWISWQPEHRSTMAYTLNRRGMQLILEKTSSVDSAEQRVWNLVEPSLLAADELLFFLAKRAYTSTFDWVSSSSRNSTKHPGAVVPVFNESILVLTNERIKSRDKIPAQIESIRQDVNAVCQYHKTCDWVVKIAANDDALLSEFESSANSTLPPNVRFHLFKTSANFHKFGILHAYLSKLTRYDYVVVKDSDQRIAGLPWATFMEKKQDALIAGPLRQTPVHSLLRTTVDGMGGSFPFFDAHEWKLKAPISAKAFGNVDAIPTAFLEMYLVLLQSDFAKWYFEKALTPDIVGQQSNYGIDLSWCGAAEIYRPSQPACVLVPVVSHHEDSKQIWKGGNFGKDSTQALEIFKKKFGPEIAKAKRWNSLGWGPGRLLGMEKRCQQRLQLEVFDWPSCIKKVTL